MLLASVVCIVAASQADIITTSLTTDFAAIANSELNELKSNWNGNFADDETVHADAGANLTADGHAHIQGQLTGDLYALDVDPYDLKLNVQGGFASIGFTLTQNVTVHSAAHLTFSVPTPGNFSLVDVSRSKFISAGQTSGTLDLVDGNYQLVYYSGLGRISDGSYQLSGFLHLQESPVPEPSSLAVVGGLCITMIRKRRTV